MSTILPRLLMPLAVVAFASPAKADDQETPLNTVEARVTYGAGGGYYVDVGSDAGVVTGTKGTILHDGHEIAQVEVRHMSATSAFVEVTTKLTDPDPAAGDRVIFSGVNPSGTTTPRAEGSGAGPGNAQPFTPLLAPYQPPEQKPLPPVWKGSLGFSVNWNRDQDTGLTFAYERLSLRGSVERLFSGPWTLDYDLDLNDRTGNGYKDDSRQNKVEPRLDLFVLRRHFEDGSVIGAGRFEPLALTGVGRVDGAYGETVVNDKWRAGVIAGLRPDLTNLGFRIHEPLLSVYGLYDRRYDRQTQLTVTNGLLVTWYNGVFDEQALLTDVYLHVPGNHWLRASSQFDLYTGDDPFRSGVGLTRLTLIGNLNLMSGLDLRASWFQFQLPDTAENRDDTPDQSAYGRGHRRAALSLDESFIKTWNFEEEVAQVAGENSGTDYQYTLRIRKTQIFGFRQLSGDAGVWNLVGEATKGLGGRLGMNWSITPMTYLRLSYNVNNTEVDSGSTFKTHTAMAMLTTSIGQSTSLWASVSRNWGDSISSLAADVGITWRF